MFCPQCGQQQTTGAIRFCSRCGFPLDGVIHLLGSGGILPVYRSPDEPVPISARRKGVKQGGLLLLSGIVLVPLLGVMTEFSRSNFLQILMAFAAIICFIGGPLRMLYAAVFEEGAQRPIGPYARPIGTPKPQFGASMPQPALPPPPIRSSGWRSRPNTAELVSPPSVTENTTRLLEKKDRTDR